MLKLIIICGIIAVYIIYSFYVYKVLNQFKYTDTYIFSSQRSKNVVIPKVIIQTYYDKSKIPDKVYKNIRKYAPDYKHIVYDDNDCINFLALFDKTYTKISKLNVVDKFKSFQKGAHKADLFRYCYLYHYGGIYIDIKTELIKPIDELFIDNNTLYTVIARNKKSIYQGVIGVYPQNPMIGELINQCLCAKNILLWVNYWLFLQFFYNCIINELNVDKISSK